MDQKTRMFAAQVLGMVAHEAGKDCIPALDPELTKLYNPGVYNAHIIRAWIKGWTLANLCGGKMKTVDFKGTVSSGTMRSQDLLPAIMEVLREYHPEAYQLVTSTISSEFDVTYTELCGHKNHSAWQDEDMSWIIGEVAWDAMNEIAPDGHYFGAHPGDGADYGFWLVDGWEVEEYCYCCGRGDRTLTPCPKCGEMLCQSCAVPFGPHVCELD